jgi:hypothetical protein
VSSLEIHGNEEFYPINLEEFTKEDAKSYLQKYITGDLGDYLELIIEEIGKVPYRLNRFIKLLSDSKSRGKDLDEILEIYKNEYSDSQLTFKNWINSTDKNEKLMWEILLIASRLEPQFCGIDVFKKSLSPEDISSLIIELERQNFISYEYKENKSGIKIIRMIQDEVDKHIDQIGDKKWYQE